MLNVPVLGKFGIPPVWSLRCSDGDSFLLRSISSWTRLSRPPRVRNFRFFNACPQLLSYSSHSCIVIDPQCSGEDKCRILLLLSWSWSRSVWSFWCWLDEVSIWLDVESMVDTSNAATSSSDNNIRPATIMIVRRPLSDERQRKMYTWYLCAKAEQGLKAAEEKGIVVAR